MTWFFKKKKIESSRLDIDTINRIEEESKKLGKQQVLYVTIKRKVSGRGEVLVGFQDRIFSDKDLIRYESDEIKSQLNKGEFKLHEGILYFYPNVDLEWKPTPKKNIHKIVSNYDFSNVEMYLEPKDYPDLQPELAECFRKENIESVYLNRNVCQLEISDLDSEKESRISESLLNFCSSFYLSPFSKPQSPR